MYIFFSRCFTLVYVIPQLATMFYNGKLLWRVETVDIPNFERTVFVLFAEAIQTTGVMILFYGSFPQLSIINILVLSSSLYIFPTFGKCIWNISQLESCLQLCNKEIWKNVFQFNLVILHGGTMIMFIVLFSKMDEWNHWTLFQLLLLGAIFTLFGWCKFSSIYNEMKMIDFKTKQNNGCPNNNAFIQCMICIWRIIIFCIGVVVMSIKFKRINEWNEFFVIFCGEKTVFNSTSVSS